MFYKIGDVVVKINGNTSFVIKECLPYKVEEKSFKNFIDLSYTDDDLIHYEDRLGKEALFEYNYTMNRFANAVVDYDAFCYHCSALSVDGEGILFSADSGTGKSTHARLWRQYMGDHEIVALNDDKPLVRIVDGKPIVYGTPWAGKHAIHSNGSAPVKALVFLEQSLDNSIERIPMNQAFELVFSQVMGGKNQKQLYHLMGLLDVFIRKVPIYKLHCNISEEAVKLVYGTIWREKDED